MLGLTRADAEAADWRATLRRAYRRLALLFHPDKNPADLEAANARFLEVSEAHRVLSDDARRAAYDAGGDVSEMDASAEAARGFSTAAERGAGRAASSGFEPPPVSGARGRSGTTRGTCARTAWRRARGTAATRRAAARATSRRRRTSTRATSRASDARRARETTAVPRRRGRRCAGAGASGARARGARTGGGRERFRDGREQVNTASATLVVNHLGLQALEFKFTVAHDPGASDAEREPRRAGASRKREPSVSMSPTRALVRERTALLAQLVYEALRVGERDGPRRADGDGTADSNSGTAAPFEMSPARAADIAAAADAAVSKARGGLDGEAALARAFEAAAAARGDVGGASASRRLSETDNSDNSTPRPIVRDAAALVSLKRLAVTMAAEMHARGDLRAASSFRSSRRCRDALKKEKPQKEWTREPRGRARALRGADARGFPRDVRRRFRRCFARCFARRRGCCRGAV